MAERGEAHELQLPYTARAQSSPLALVVVLGVCVSLLLLAVRPGGAGGVLITTLLVCLWLCIAGLLAWLGSYRVILLPDRIRSARLGSAREMAYADLREVTLARVGPRVRGDERPPQLLCLRGLPDERAGERTLEIAIRPFRERDMAILLDAVEQLAPQARLDDSVRALRPTLLSR